MKLWDSDLGIWNLVQTRWVSVHGTTPRNADVWTLALTFGKRELEFVTGPHARITMWTGNSWTWEIGRNDPKCKCYNCQMMAPPPLEFWAKVKEIEESGGFPVRKLPPRKSDGA